MAYLPSLPSLPSGAVLLDVLRAYPETAGRCWTTIRRCCAARRR